MRILQIRFKNLNSLAGEWAIDLTHPAFLSDGIFVITGPTGAGKTTVINLISRFYDIEDGVISVDGYDLTKISIESLRRQMGVMTQDNFIFHGTVRENILYGKTDTIRQSEQAGSSAVSWKRRADSG